MALENTIGKVGNEIASFGQGLFHGGIENPVNAVVQGVNHFSPVDLPELHIVDAPPPDSIGGKLGTIVGAAADVYFLNKATGHFLGKLGGDGISGAALRTGITGGIYGSVFTPSAPNAKNFYLDRLGNGAVGFATFAAMGATSGLLDKAGLFAVPEARSLMGSIGYGAISGVPAGLVHAEANAIFKEGKPLASGSAFVGDAASFAAFGGAFGAIGYAGNKIDALLNNRSVTISSDAMRSVTVQSDSNGQPVRVTEVRPADNYYDTLLVRNVATKMTNGRWSADSRAFDAKTGSYDNWIPTWSMSVNNVKVSNGNIRIVDDQGYVREYTANNFKTHDISTPKIDDPSFGGTNWKGEKQFSGNGRSTTIDNEGRISRYVDAKGGSMNVDYKNGDVQYFNMSDAQGQRFSFVPNEQGGGYRLNMNNGDIYNWNGTIQVSGDAANSPTIQLTPANGKPVQFTFGQDIKPVNEMLASSAKFMPGAGGTSYVTVDANGSATLHTEKAQWERIVSVNGTPVQNGTQSIQIKPGDQIGFKVDVGDRYPEWEAHTLDWTTAADGTPLFGGKPVKSASAFNVSARSGRGS